MKKLTIAIVGHGRSGRNIHGKYLTSELNTLYTVKYIVDADERRRGIVGSMFPDAEVLSSHTELFDKDVDLVVNATYSNDHYRVSKDLLEHGKNVLTEKPFGRSYFECSELMRIAEKKGVVLAVFHNTQGAPYYLKAKEIIESGRLGKISEISIRYNGYARRWDWQTSQEYAGGSVLNTGPHPLDQALDLLGFPEEVNVFSKLGCVNTFGDAEDYAKILITAPGKPLMDIEINSTDAYSGYNVKIQGTKGTFKCTPAAYEMTYIVDGENPERPVVEGFLKDDKGEPIYCSEKLVKHEEAEKFQGTAFDVGTASLYKQLYDKITAGTPMTVTPEMAAQVISVVEIAHANSPLPLKF